MALTVTTEEEATQTVEKLTDEIVGAVYDTDWEEKSMPKSQRRIEHTRKT